VGPASPAVPHARSRFVSSRSINSARRSARPTSPAASVFRRGRPFYSAELPLAELASAAFPKLVVSGGHHAGFEAMSDDLALRIGASRAVVAGAGHEIQFTGTPLNEALRSLWSATP